jgi:hypothetical protein
MDSYWKKEDEVMIMKLGCCQDLGAGHQKKKVIERTMHWDRVFVTEGATPHLVMLSADSASCPVAEKLY